MQVEYVIGDSQEWLLEATNEGDDSVFDLTGHEVSAKIVGSEMDVELATELVDAVNGKAKINLTAVQSATLEGDYYFEIRIVKEPDYSKRVLKRAVRFVE